MSWNHKIYIIRRQSDGALKIGCSRVPSERVKQIATAEKRKDLSLFYFREVDRDGYAVERAIHRMLEDRQIRNEWFDVDLERVIHCIEESVKFVEGGGIPKGPRTKRPQELQA